jgi:hypothetical protein
MNIDEELAKIAVWETERVVSQASRCRTTGTKTAAHGGEWDTCFELCFQRVLDAWTANHAGEA